MRQCRVPIIVMAVVCSLYAAFSVWAADADFQRIRAADLKAMVDSGERVLIVDVRPADDFMGLHITGAVSVPLLKVREKLAGLAPDTKIAFY